MSEQVSGPKSESTSKSTHYAAEVGLWPKTNGDVTDWEQVFEHPDKGFIPLIKDSQSPLALKVNALAIIEKIFVREGDKQETSSFIADLENIFANCDFVETRDAIIVLLRNIKELRIEKNEEYLARIRHEELKERRTQEKHDHGLNLAPFKYLKLTRKETGVFFGSMTVAIAALVFGVIALVGLDNFLGLFTAPKLVELQPIVMEKAVREVPPSPKGVAYSFKITTPAIYMVVRPDGKKSYRTLYQPTIFLINDEEKRALCKNWPMVLEALNQVLYRVHPKQELASEVHLTKANRLAAKVINRTIGLDAVTWVSFEPTNDMEAAVDSVRKCHAIKI